MGLSAGRAILYGTAVVGTLDALDAVIYFGLRGVAPVRVFQGIASGLLGRASFEGGLPTAVLGLALHFFIAFAIVAAYYLASRRLPLLRRRPILCGIAYGIGVYIFMNCVVLPLSAIGWPRFSTASLVNGLLIHVFGVGLPSALFAARAEPIAGAPRTAVLPS
jgi:hypothetical protein